MSRPAVADLRALLQKEVAIHTFSAQDLQSIPEDVERAYRIHAATHVEMPDTAPAWKDIKRQVLQNKSIAFAKVVGEFGSGKTSLLIHLWTECESAGILGIPPFRWDHFDEVFSTTASWVRHEFKKKGIPAIGDLDRLIEQYVGPRLETESKRRSMSHGLPYEKVFAMMKQQYDEGVLRLDLTVDDLYSLCHGLVELIKPHGYKGLLVMMDELHHAAQLRSVNAISDTLFLMGTKARATQGSFGFVFGMPPTLEAGIRGDVAPRWTAEIKLRCSETFANSLWDAYVKKFGLSDVAENMASSDVLKSLGQLTDSNKHRRLADGPRTIVTAFKRIARLYLNGAGPYTPFDLVEDCLAKEVILGDQSVFTEVLEDILNRDSVKGRYDGAIRLLAAFPDGLPRSKFEEYGLGDELDLVIREGFGDLVSESFEGYYLIPFRTEAPKESYLDSRIKSFTRGYSADANDISRAVEVFKEQVIPSLFPMNSSEWSSREGPREMWHSMKNGASTTWLFGSFAKTSRKYPNREVQITIAPESVRKPARQDEQPNHAGHFVFVLHTSIKHKKAPQRAVRLDDATITFHLNLQAEVERDLHLHRIVDRSLVTPLYLLTLLHELREDKQAPSSEEGALKVVLDEALGGVISTLFNEHLGEIASSDISVKSTALSYFPELFEALCQRRFPEYVPIAPLRLMSKMLSRYLSALENQRVPLEAKRGHKPLFSEIEDVKTRRQEIAKVFGGEARISAFQTFLSELGCLVRFDWEQGEVYLLPHPMERTVLDLLDHCEPADRIAVEGALCDSISPNELIKAFFSRGYEENEMQAIIRLGVARQYFRYDASKRRIYRKPLDPDEWRKELNDRLQGIVQLVSLLPKKEWPAFDPTALKEEIQRLNSDEAYEALRLHLGGMMAATQQALLTRALAMLNAIRREVGKPKAMLDELAAPGSLLQRMRMEATGAVRWVEALNGHRAALLRRFADLRTASQTLISDLAEEERRMGEVGDILTRQDPHLTFARLSELQAQFESDATDLSERCSGWRAEAKAYFEWLSVLDLAKTCDSFCRAAQSLGSTRFGAELDALHERVDVDLRKGAEALLNAALYRNLYSELQKKAAETVTNAQSVFLAKRGGLTEALRALDPALPPLTTQFRETDPQGSYEELADEAARVYSRAVESLTGSLEACYADVKYSIEVLGLDESALYASLNTLASVLQRIGDLPGPSSFAELEDYDSIRESFKECRDTIKTSTAALRSRDRGKLTETQEQLLSCLGPQEVTLKQLILTYHSKKGGTMDLEDTLNNIKELFKKDLVQIRVRKV